MKSHHEVLLRKNQTAETVEQRTCATRLDYYERYVHCLGDLHPN